MTQSKHTPGPWESAYGSRGWISTKGDPYGHGSMHVADVRGWGHLTGKGACAMSDDEAVVIQKANAKLIIASPDLLDACAAALRVSDLWLPSVVSAEHEHEAAVLHKMRDKLLAAFKEATGGEDY